MKKKIPDEGQLGLFTAPTARRRSVCKACGLFRGQGHKTGCPNEKAPPRRALFEYSETTDAIDTVERHAHKLYLETAYTVGISIARRAAELSPADIDEAMVRDFPNVQTHDKRALGAVMRRLSSRGYIAKAAKAVQDPRRHCHNTPIQIWRSLVYVMVQGEDVTLRGEVRAIR